MLANFALSGACAPSAAGPKPFSMELKQLDYFLGVAESGSFSKAAIRLSVAQPILSRQIKLLESELGVKLLYRNGRGVVVSEAGKVLETYARSVVGLVEKAQSEIGSLKAEPRGRVAIAMPPSIGWMLTGPLVVRCREAFPQILLHLAEGFVKTVQPGTGRQVSLLGRVHSRERVLPTISPVSKPNGSGTSIGGGCLPSFDLKSS